GAGTDRLVVFGEARTWPAIEEHVLFRQWRALPVGAERSGAGEVVEECRHFVGADIDGAGGDPGGPGAALVGGWRGAEGAGRERAWRPASGASVRAGGALVGVGPPLFARGPSSGSVAAMTPPAGNVPGLLIRLLEPVLTGALPRLLGLLTLAKSATVAAPDW